MVTVYAPVASLPAAKTTSSPCVQFNAVLVPAATRFQLAAPVVLQVPLGVAPPAPATAPFTSQYAVAPVPAPRKFSTRSVPLVVIEKAESPMLFWALLLKKFAVLSENLLASKLPLNPRAALARTHE